jgi:dTDP-4-amino-4,6-dideoxygalactose transaminase
MINNPYRIVKMFEEEISHYTGSPYVITVDSCTSAIFLVCKYLKVKTVTIPSQTYLSVPQSIIHSGGEVIFDKRFKTNHWKGIYQLKPYPIYDAAKRFTKNMYILCDNKKACEWFKKARYEGRSEKYYKDDDITFLGWNMYMTPQQAAHGLSMMQNYPEHKEDLQELNGYRDLTEFTVFKNNKIIK